MFFIYLVTKITVLIIVVCLQCKENLSEEVSKEICLEKWIKKMWYIYLNAMECYSAIKKNEILRQHGRTKRLSWWVKYVREGNIL